MDTLAFGYILPTTGRIQDLHLLETCAARRTMERGQPEKAAPQTLYFFFRLRMFSQIAPPTMNITSTMAITVFASIP